MSNEHRITLSELEQQLNCTTTGLNSIDTVQGLPQYGRFALVILLGDESRQRQIRRDNHFVQRWLTW